VRKDVDAGADVFRTKAARGHALEISHGDVVRNLKGRFDHFEIDSGF